MGRLLEILSGKRTAPALYSPVGQSVNEDLLRRGDGDYEPTTFWRRNQRFILLQLFLLSLYSLAAYVFVAGTRGTCACRPPLSYSLGSTAVEWEQREFFDWDGIQEEGSTYFGEPRDELDTAWADLLHHKNIRIEAEVIRGLGREEEAVRVPGEDWALGTLSVYHELHCIRFLHQHIEYPSSDHNNIAKRSAQAHNEHCLDFLRQSAMCRGDVSLVTYKWETTMRDPGFNFTAHQCVDWEKLDAWAGERTVDVYKPGWLVHPTLGKNWGIA